MRQPVGGAVYRRERNRRELTVASGIEFNWQPPAIGINRVFHRMEYRPTGEEK
jgi:hypothetical protein